MQTMTMHTAESDTSRPAQALKQEFCVGAWRVWPHLNRLQRRQGSLVRHLEPRLIHLLCYLAANPERVLSRDELVSELWPRVIVNENSLTRAISELRKHLTLPDQPGQSYIETIPKKGYRLLPTVETEVAVATVRAASWLPARPVLAGLHPTYRTAFAALCFSLVFGLWFGAGSFGGLTEAGLNPVMLSDEVLNQQPGYFGGEVTLSAAEENQFLAKPLDKSMEAPVISNDESRYAYIQRDSSGSTIFLGRLDALAEPVVPVLKSPDKLFNLAWSPLGQGLIFARQPKLTTAALFSDERSNAELFMLDLATLETHRLLQEIVPSDSEASKPQNLT